MKILPYEEPTEIKLPDPPKAVFTDPISTSDEMMYTTTDGSTETTVEDNISTEHTTDQETKETMKT